MVLEHLTHFVIVIFIQLLFFLFHTVKTNNQANIKRFLLQGMLIGLAFGICFDLIFGKFIGMFAYELGFPLWFLVLNGFFSYGLMMANVLLLYHHSVLHMYFWSLLLGLTYEISNYFFPVWEWTFSYTLIEYVIVSFAAYFGLTLLMMCTLRVTLGIRFKLVPF